ncbi:MAG: glycosyltransferase family 4 protein [Thermofilum sp.]|nr:glycosyltransferase family 4 protein [Thermofilum sp.]
MKVLFQTIGILTQYNWALPYYLVNIGDQNLAVSIKLYTDAFSYLMGGFYYHLKRPRKLIPVFSGTGLFSELDRTLNKVGALYKLSHFDVIHLNKATDELTDIALKTEVPKVFTFHGSLDPSHIKDINSMCECLEKISEKAIFVAVSQYSSNTLAKYCNIKARVIHNGVDVSLFNPLLPRIEARRKLGLPSDKRIILWSGRIDPDKRLDTLLRIAPKILRERKDAIILVKGRTINKNYLAYLKGLIRKGGLERFIKLDLGWTPNIFMLYYYRASDLYVHTSISEGFSLTLLEAMASGIPVMGRNASSMPEAIGDKSLLFNDEDELAEKILEVLSNEEESEKIGIRLFHRVIEEGFTSIDQAKKYLDLYEEIISQLISS